MKRKEEEWCEILIRGVGEVGGVWEGFDDEVRDEQEEDEEQRYDENVEYDSVDGGDEEGEGRGGGRGRE